FKIVKSFMAHHQGMSFLALVNVLNDFCMQRRLHADPLMQSVELLLQERVPATRDINPQAHERMLGQAEKQTLSDENRFVTINTAESQVPVTHFVSNGHYSAMVTNSGSGFSKFNDMMVSRWREDVTRDAWGTYFYIQNLNSGSYWSATHMPVGTSGENYQVTYAPDRVEFCRQDGNIRTKTEIVVSPEDAVEVRRISLTNQSNSDRTLEITSYFEVVLARLNEDLAHPAFGNLFIETEYFNGSLLASRRPRREGQARPWLMHSVALEGEGIGGVQYETDRSKFIGRGRNLARPRALEVNKPLSNSVGAVLDPIMSLRQRIRIRPGETVRVAFSVGFATSREEIVHLAEKYRDPSAVDRVFELAWTYCQMELRHLNLTPLQANEALALGGNLLYLSPCRREHGEILARNCLGQSALWPHAISGDLPVVLVRVWEKDHLELVRQFLVVHEYWRLKGLQLDLVILNEDKSGYYQVMHEQLRDLVSTGHARELLGRSGGVFLLQKNHLSQAELDLIYTVARVVFSGEGGSCSVQLRKQGKLLTVKAKTGSYPPKALDLEETEYTEKDKGFAPKPNLLFFNGYGGFNQDGREYLIELGKGLHTPLPWINVIANHKFGCQVSESGSGYTWSSNSRENKLTPWSNDPVVDQPGEVIYLRDEATGEVWTTTRGPIRDHDKYLIRHGQGYSIFLHSSHGINQELLMFVPVDQPVKLSQLSLHNTSGTKRRLTVTYYAELVLGVARELTAPYLVTDFLPENSALTAHNTYQEEFAGRTVFLRGFGGNLRSYTGDRTEFLGRN
ncbi:MAG TPA: glycosyl transferase family 36, partial [Verrucomicrobiae bacterium]|nr:glycosyl transferase family 36 [Verrucomicrobiae bacterium]